MPTRSMPRPLRVLQVVSSSATSGAEHHTVVLARMLARHGHFVEVVCPPIPWMLESLRDAGITTHPLDMRKAMGLSAQRELFAVVRGGRFDVIHTHLSRATYLGAVVGAALRVPVISSVHVETKEPIYKWMARGRNRLVAVSNYIHGVLKGQGARADAIDVVYNGTDFGDIHVETEEEVHAEFGIPLERKLVGLVGRVAPEKGHQVALRALPAVLERDPNLQLLFIGRTDGDFHDQLREEAQVLGVGDHLTFTGNRNDIPRLFDAMVFSILPSVMESFGLAVIECMARGRPVVASNVGALTELVIHEETGLLVEPTPASLAAAMHFLLANPDMCLNMGRNARIVIQEKFTVAQMVERLEAVYYKTAGVCG
ncbi:MAG: glycosyltransferase family 4 protein [Armatimonadetes bacterium]|nr:glycosyltransferase family 4 protein [Armatimonadota bacterium]